METSYHPQALTADQLSALSQEVKQALTDLYGDRLDRIVLYGSYARSDFHAESDVDYMVVLRDEKVKLGREIWFVGEVMSDLSDKFHAFVSFKPTSSLKYTTSSLLFYQNVRREGKIL